MGSLDLAGGEGLVWEEDQRERGKKHIHQRCSQPEKPSASTDQKRGLVYTKSLVFKGKEGENHMHQRAFEVFVGDLLTQPNLIS